MSKPLPGGGVEQWPVGVVDGEVTGEKLKSFAQRVHRQFASADPSVPSELVYSGGPASNELVIEAQRHGLRLRSFVDYQGLIDLRPLVARQAERLATDPIYPTELYVPSATGYSTTIRLATTCSGRSSTGWARTARGSSCCSATSGTARRSCSAS